MDFGRTASHGRLPRLTRRVTAGPGQGTICVNSKRCTATPRLVRSTVSHMAERLAETLNGYSRRPEATDLLSTAIEEFEDANHGVLPVSANDALSRLIAFMEFATHYRSGEALLLAQLKHPIHTQQKYWLTLLINDLYLQALQNRESGIYLAPARRSTLREATSYWPSWSCPIKTNVTLDSMRSRASIAPARMFRSPVPSDDFRAFAFGPAGRPQGADLSITSRSFATWPTRSTICSGQSRRHRIHARSARGSARLAAI